MIPRLRHDVASRYRYQRTVVRDAVFLIRLRDRQLVIAGESELAIDDIEDGVRSPRRRIDRTTAGSSAAAPFVGEDNLRPSLLNGLSQ